MFEQSGVFVHLSLPEVEDKHLAGALKIVEKVD